MKKHSRSEPQSARVQRASTQIGSIGRLDIEKSLASREGSERFSVDDPSKALLTEREREIIARFEKEWRETREYRRRLHTSPAEEQLLTGLTENFVKTLRSGHHRCTLRRMDSWPHILTELRSSDWKPPESIQEPIADILCAAQLVSERTIDIQQRKRDKPTGAARQRLNNWFEKRGKGRDLDALDLHRIHKKERSILKRFKRTSTLFLKHLETYRSALAEYEARLFSENVLSDCRTCIAYCKSLEKTINDGVKTEPERHGTRLIGWDSQSPKNLAASLVIPLLRDHGDKKHLAELRCAHLLAIVWPEMRRELSDSRQQEALLNRLRQAYLRSVRPHPRTTY